MKKIQSLPKAYDEGTGKEGVQPNSDDSEGVLETGKAGAEAVGTGVKTGLSKLNEYRKRIGLFEPSLTAADQEKMDTSPQMSSDPFGGSSQNVIYKPIDLGQKEGENAIVPPPQSSGQPDYSQPRQQAQVPEEYKPVTAEQELSDIQGIGSDYEKTVAGINANRGKVFKQMDSDLRDAGGSANEDLALNDIEHDELKQKVSEGKIDPNRIWHDAGTGGRIAAGLGILIAGMGSGLTGQPNMALKVIDDAIDKDIESQKADLGKTQSLLSLNMQKRRDIRQAYLDTKSQYLTLAQAKLNEYQNQTNDAHTKYAIGIESAKLGLESQQLRAQRARYGLEQDVTLGSKKASPQMLQAIYPEKSNLLVSSPDGKIGMWANSPEGAAKVNDMSSKVNKARMVLDKFHQVSGPTAWNTLDNKTQAFWTTAARESMHELATIAGGQKGESPEQKENIDSMVGSANAWQPERADENFKNLNNFVDSYEDSVYGANVPAYKNNKLRANERPK
jgi:hypothetical protein